MASAPPAASQDARSLLDGSLGLDLLPLAVSVAHQAKRPLDVIEIILKHFLAVSPSSLPGILRRSTEMGAPLEAFQASLRETLMGLWHAYTVTSRAVQEFPLKSSSSSSSSSTSTRGDVYVPKEPKAVPKKRKRTASGSTLLSLPRPKAEEAPVVVLSASSVASIRSEVQRKNEQIRKEMTGICERVAGVFWPYCSTTTGSPDVELQDDAAVFCHVCYADCCSFMCRLHEARSEADALRIKRKRVLEAHRVIEDRVQMLSVSGAIRLRRGLHLAEHLWEVLGDAEGACRLAKETFENAIEWPDEDSEDEYIISTMILQQLKDDLTIWTREDEDEGKMRQPSPREETLEDAESVP